MIDAALAPGAALSFVLQAHARRAKRETAAVSAPSPVTNLYTTLLPRRVHITSRVRMGPEVTK